MTRNNMQRGVQTDGTCKGLAKLGNIVVDANLASWMQENVFESGQKQFCFPDANFFLATQMFSIVAT